MTAETLSSHHLNYLVWRYLQEAGHGEAAAKLQRDWNLDPQSLPFAEYVKTHALVTIVQKGLQYDAIERSLGQNEHLDETLPHVGFFGPVAPLPPSFPPQDAAGRAQSPSKLSTLPRRYPRENGTNGLLSETSSQVGAKRSRKSAETANGIDRPMESDATEKSLNGLAINGNGYIPMLLTDHALSTASASNFTGPKSPTNDEAADEDIDADVDMGMSGASETTTPIFPQTEGPSAGVQTWNELREITRPPSRTQVDPPAETLPVAEGMHVISASFNPQNPNIFVATGKQMCRLWNRNADASGPSYSHQYDDIIHLGSGTAVTAVAWDSRGYRLAVATFKQSEWGQVNIYDDSGFMTDTLPGAQNLITTLRWQPNESQLLGISSDGEVSEVIVWDLSSEESLAPMKVTISATDAIWTGLNQFHACGGGTVYACRADRDIQVTNSQSVGSDQPDAEDWTYIRFAPAESYSVTVVASADKSTIWIPEHEIMYKPAHEAGMTGIEFRPRPPTDPTLKDPITLVTSSMDGSVKGWAIRVPNKQIFQVWSLQLGVDLPAMSLSWSPDSAFLAAVCGSSMFVWKVEGRREPRLAWISNFNDFKDSALEDDGGPSISWAADSSCVVYGRGKQLSIVNVTSTLRLVLPTSMSG